MLKWNPPEPWTYIANTYRFIVDFIICVFPLEQWVIGMYSGTQMWEQNMWIDPIPQGTFFVTFWNL